MLVSLTGANLVAWLLDVGTFKNVVILVVSVVSVFLFVSGFRGLRKSAGEPTSSEPGQGDLDLGLSQAQKFELAKQRQAFWFEFFGNEPGCLLVAGGGIAVVVLVGKLVWFWTS